MASQPAIEKRLNNTERCCEGKETRVIELKGGKTPENLTPVGLRRLQNLKRRDVQLAMQ